VSDLPDDDLRAVLWQASGPDCDTSDAMRQVHARVRRIRRRRVDAFCLVLLAALVVTLGVASRSHTQSTPERPTTDVTVAPPSTASAPTVPVAASEDPAATTPGTAGWTAPAAEALPTDTAGADAATPDGSAAPATAPPEDQPNAADPNPPATSEASAPPMATGARTSQQTFRSRGGQLTVATTNGS